MNDVLCGGRDGLCGGEDGKYGGKDGFYGGKDVANIFIIFFNIQLKVGILWGKGQFETFNWANNVNTVKILVSCMYLLLNNLCCTDLRLERL